jgi:D-alanyl-D-alanine dipeptidase
MQRFTREGAHRPWRRVGRRTPVVIGRRGMAWGNGLHPPEQGRGPLKREGDQRAPAGLFLLPQSFGYARRGGESRLPYLPLTADIVCVDDPQSASYNRLVDRARVSAPDWKSAERMRRRDGLYRWGVWVAHNVAPAVPGEGSCIFLHIWKNPFQGTAGCTALAPRAIRRLWRWLDPAANPVLAQLPAPEHARLCRAWGLPCP